MTTKLCLMSNDRALLAELRRHNLLMTLLQRQIIADAVGNEQPSAEDLESARNQFLKKMDSRILKQ